MMEQEYLELMNELKKKHDAVEEQKKAFELREAKYKIDMATVFGLVRAGDRLLNNIEIPDDFITVWELICDFVFTSTKKNIIGVPVQEQPVQLEVHVINDPPPSSTTTEEDEEETNN